MSYQISKAHQPTGRKTWRTWVRRGFYFCLISAVVGMILLTILLKPSYDKAQSFDLSQIDKFEAASVVYDRQGSEVGRIYEENRLTARFSELPEQVVKALVAAEDTRFYQHDGVDYLGILRAVKENVMAREINQGASTITQQLARQTFNLMERRLTRKFTEAFLARRIEKHFRDVYGYPESKNKIMEAYLNRIYFGHGAHGIKAAALSYFGKTVQELGWEEAAMICAVIKNPKDVSPLNNPDFAKRQRNMVIDRMRKGNMITQEDCDRLKQTPVVTNPLKSMSRGTHVFDYIRGQANRIAGEEAVAAGGLRIFTTLDLRLQMRADRSMNEKLKAIESREGYAHETYEQYVTKRKSLPKDAKPPDPAYLQGALLAIDNEDGGIVAMVGGRSFEHSNFNCATMAYRPSGTAITPFVYANAFSQEEEPLFPGSLVQDTLLDNISVGIGGVEGLLGEFGTEVDQPMLMGDITARRALALGKNAATVRVGMKAGLPSFLELYNDLGIKTSVGKTKLLIENNSSFLGKSPLSLSDLVKAYTVFPNGGSRPKELYIIREIQSSDGTTLFKQEKSQDSDVDVIDYFAAHQTHGALEDVLSYGTGRKAGQLGLKPIPSVAGKSGTVHDYTDAWFVGYDSSITCGVWTGFMKEQGPIYKGAFGSEVAMPIWIDIMNESLANFPPKPIEPPEGARKVEICSVSGQIASDNCYEQTIDPNSASPRSRRCAVVEYIRPEMHSLGTCRIHTPDAELEALRQQAGELVITNTGNISADADPPVRLRQPTLMGTDPYQSIQPVVYDPSKTAGPTTVGGEVKEAEVVVDLPLNNDTARVPLEAPKPIEFDD